MTSTANTQGLKLREAKPIIQRVCREAVAEAKIGGPNRVAGTSAALDPVLWFYGKYGCSYCENENSSRRALIGKACEHCKL